MKPKEILALADRVDRVKSYGAIELRADLKGIDHDKFDNRVRVILIDAKRRKIISKALRQLANPRDTCRDRKDSVIEWCDRSERRSETKRAAMDLDRYGVLTPFERKQADEIERLRNGLKRISANAEWGLRGTPNYQKDRLEVIVKTVDAILEH